MRRPTLASVASYGTIMAVTIAEGILGYLIGPYLQEMGYSLATIGFLYSLPHAVGLLSRMPTGLLYRGARARGLLTGGALALAATALLFLHAPNLAAITGLRALQGMAMAVLTTVALAHFLGSHGTQATRGRALGYYSSAMAAGYAIGSTLGGLIADGWGYPIAFVTAAACALSVVLLGTWLPPAIAAAARSAESLGGRARLWRALRDPGLLYAALVGFMHHFLFYLFAAFFPLYALAAGINLTQIGFLRGAFALINAAVRGLSGLVLERVGRRHAVTIGLLCHLAALVAIPYFQSFVPLLIVIGFLGFWRAVVLVANTIGLAEDPDPGRVPRGIASGVYHAAADLAGLTAGVAGGAVAVAAGLDNLFRVLPTVAIAVYLVFAVGLERAARSASLARAATEPRHS